MCYRCNTFAKWTRRNELRFGDTVPEKVEEPRGNLGALRIVETGGRIELQYEPLRRDALHQQENPGLSDPYNSYQRLGKAVHVWTPVILIVAL